MCEYSQYNYKNVNMFFKKKYKYFYVLSTGDFTIDLPKNVPVPQIGSTIMAYGKPFGKYKVLDVKYEFNRGKDENHMDTITLDRILVEAEKINK